jgi:hypothetical protein
MATTEQGRLFPETSSSPVAPPIEDAEVAPVWLQRMSLVVLVVFCFYIGGLLVLLPWNTRWWVENGWLQAHPLVDEIAQRGWVRGMISGVGIIDIWIGVSEMIHYRDFRP